MKKSLLKQLITAIALMLLLISTNSNAQTLTLQLTPSNFNGYNISCFGLSDGSIDLTVTGGTTPYTYEWSYDAQANNEDLANIPANYYHVIVTDANGATGEAEITLTQPEQIRMDLSVYRYPNGFNISQNNACNGNVTSTITGGVTPYTYHWNPGNQTVASPSNLCGRENILELTDDNGCKTKQTVILSEPPVASWTMSGNAGSSPSTNFIGTTDNIDFLLKTNGSERMRIKANGDIKIPSLSGTGSSLIQADANGNVSRYPCSVWSTCGNSVLALDFIGSTNNVDVPFKTNNQEVMRLKNYGKISIKEFVNQPYGLLYTDNLGDISKIDFDYMNPTNYLDATGSWHSLPAGSSVWNVNGNNIYNSNSGSVGIGTSTPSQKLEVAHNDGAGIAGGMLLNNLSSANKNSEIKFNQGSTNLWSIGNDVAHNNSQNFFIYDNLTNSGWGATRFFIDANGKVGINTTTPSKSLEVSHDESNGGMALNRLNATTFKNQISFQQNGVEKWAVGVDKDQNNNDNFYIWHGSSGSAKFYINNIGNVGIGNTNPSEKLEVSGKGKFSDVQATSLSGNAGKLIQLDANGNFQASSVSTTTASLWNNTGTTVYYNSGKVFIGMSSCIGCTDPSYNLYVQGGIAARDVKVTATNFPDYVFAKNYRRMSLYELEQYIKINNRLPEMPSAKEVEKNNGYELGTVVTLLVKQNEEQALYLIEQQKQIDELKAQIKNLERRK